MVRIFQGLGKPRISLLTVGLFISLQFIFSPAFAAPDDDFLAARDAYIARNNLRLEQYARKSSAHALAPFTQYWQLSLNLDTSKPEDVKAFLDNNADVYVSDRLRAEWLKILGKQKQWASFQAELPLLVNEDPDVNCYQLQARLAPCRSIKRRLLRPNAYGFRAVICPVVATRCSSNSPMKNY